MLVSFLRRHKHSTLFLLSLFLLVGVTIPVTLYVYFYLFPDPNLSLESLISLHRLHNFLFLLDAALAVNLALLLYSSHNIAWAKGQAVLDNHIDVSTRLLQLTNGVLNGNKQTWVYDRMLNDLLELTESEFGFVGEALEDKDGIFLKTFNISDIAWDAASKDLYRPQGMEFRNLNTLFGTVLVTGETCICNEPATDPRSGGLPPGHPEMHSFLGIALKHSNKLIGMIGVANRKGGYNKKILDNIALYINSCGSVLWEEKIKKENIAKTNEFLALIESMSDGILIIDQESVIEKVNPSLLKMFEYEESELLGSNISILMQAGEAEAHRKGLDRYLATGQKSIIGKPGVPVSAITKSGKILPIEITVNEIILETKTLFCGVVRDISEKLKSRIELETSLQEQKILIDTANAPIFGINKYGVINVWNQKAVRITGYMPTEVFGKSLFDTISEEEHRQSIHDVMNRALDGDEVANFHLPIISKDGRRIDIILNATPRRDVSGEICGVIGVGQDITEMLNSKARAERIASELTLFMENANAPIIGIDKHGLINEWNRNISEITGYEKNAVVGKKLIPDFISSTDQVKIAKIFKDALQGLETAIFEISLPSRDNKQIDILANAITRVDFTGNIVGVISVGQDITQLKQKNLELQTSQKLESIGLLTGGLAHDFNNLLAVILGNLEYLRLNSKIQSSNLIEVVDDAISAADDGAKLIKSLLAFAKNQKLEPANININNLIEAFYRLLRGMLPKSIEISLVLSRDTPHAMVDSIQLDSALLNLCINAADAMRDVGQLTIATGMKTIGPGDADKPNYIKPGRYACIVVTDTGVGIDKDALEHVFEPFYSKKQIGKGSGLGLSMVYGFVTQSKGSISIDSTVGQGTTFTILLPGTGNSMDDSTTVSNQEGEEGEEGVVPDIQSSAILVVEDELAVRKLVTRTLQDLGYTVYQANSAASALEMLSNGLPVDILFSDIIMPGEMTGRTLAEWVSGRYPHIKILLTSGFEEFSRDGDDSAQQTFPIIKKPYKNAALRAALNELYTDSR